MKVTVWPTYALVGLALTMAKRVFVTAMEALPVIDGDTVSVAVIVCVPAVPKMTPVKVLEPPGKVESEGKVKESEVVVKVTVPA